MLQKFSLSVRIADDQIETRMDARKLSKNVSDLTLALVITSNVIISCQSATTHLYKKGGDIQPELPSERKQLTDRFHASHEVTNLKNGLPDVTGRRGKRGGDPLAKWHLTPIQIQLDIVVERYRVVSQRMEDIYYGVIACGLNGCHNFRGFIPQPKHESNAVIFNKRRRHFGKKVYEMLETFHEGLQKIGSSFDLVMKYENTSAFHDGRRSTLLKELKTDISVLNLEVETALSERNSVIIPTKNDIIYEVFPYPSNQTDLIIEEWYIILGSKRFLVEWQKILRDLETELRKLLARRSRNRAKKKNKLEKKATIQKKRKPGRKLGNVQEKNG